MLLDGFGERPENHVCSMGEQFRYPVGVVLSISVEGPSFGGLSRGVQSRLGELGIELPPKHSRPFGVYDARAWVEASTQTF